MKIQTNPGCEEFGSEEGPLSGDSEVDPDTILHGPTLQGCPFILQFTL